MARSTVLFALATLTTLASCNLRDMSKGRAAAERQVAVFHERLDAGDLDAIYDSADDDFRAASSREKMNKLLGAVRRKLGKVENTANKGWHVGSVNLRTQVRLVQETKFEHGTGVETFVWTIRDGEALLNGYDISSEGLVVR